MYKIGQPFIVLPKIDSTNNYAMKEAKMGNLSFGTVFFAIDQTHGKGQRSKTWESKPGENIMMSIYADPMGMNISQQVLISFATAIACHKFLKKYAGEETSIKWPNDIYWRDRKAGGILIENIFAGQTWKHCVIGIGININEVKFDPILPNPVSLKQITGKTFDLLEQLNNLFQCLQVRWNQLYTGKLSVLEYYNNKLYKKEQVVTIKKDNRVFSATIKGVSANGQMEVFSTEAEFLNHGENYINY